MVSNTAVSGTVPMPAAFARTSLPGRIIFGDGAVGLLAGELDQRDLQRAMLIVASHDAQLAERGSTALGERVRLHWDEVRQHVPLELAQRATNAATAAGIDVLVAIGGGSTTGLGKAISVATGLPLAVAPTTYAGSEMTPIYGLTSDNDKKTARDLRALPSIVVYDPQLLITLPAAVVGPSGLNALAHCAEALWRGQLPATCRPRGGAGAGPGHGHQRARPGQEHLGTRHVRGDPGRPAIRRHPRRPASTACGSLPGQAAPQSPPARVRRPPPGPSRSLDRRAAGGVMRPRKTVQARGAPSPAYRARVTHPARMAVSSSSWEERWLSRNPA